MAILDRLGIGWPRRGPPVDHDLRAAIPAGWRVYAIGDIHGRFDLMGALFEHISKELKADPPQVAVTIFLGDYVDRGPQSFDVVDTLARGRWPTPVVGLLGNHEDILLRFLEDETVLEAWRQWGALETLASYGVDIQLAIRSRDYKAVQADFLARVPDLHLRFLRQLEPCYTIGDYFFCHAGVKPGIALDAQKRDDLIMIREPFLSCQSDFGKIVVHGHTPTQEPVVAVNRIGIDTGAYATGRLTALALEGETRRLLSAVV
jgi:serine/threonine protein phosphatase 1